MSHLSGAGIPRRMSRILRHAVMYKMVWAVIGSQRARCWPRGLVGGGVKEGAGRKEVELSWGCCEVKRPAN
jgi:hypothetical protein